MKPNHLKLWSLRWTSLPALLAVGGCLSRVERGADMLFSPGAIDNALALPYSTVLGLAKVFVRLWYG